MLELTTCQELRPARAPATLYMHREPARTSRGLGASLPGRHRRVRNSRPLRRASAAQPGDVGVAAGGHLQSRRPAQACGLGRPLGSLDREHRGRARPTMSTCSSSSSAGGRRPKSGSGARSRRGSRSSPPTNRSSPMPVPSCSRPPARSGRHVRFEAAVAGGVPVVRAIEHGLAGDTLTRVAGILNGTCNYILSRMERDRVPFQEALVGGAGARAGRSGSVPGHRGLRRAGEAGDPRARGAPRARPGQRHSRAADRRDRRRGLSLRGADRLHDPADCLGRAHRRSARAPRGGRARARPARLARWPASAAARTW